MKKYIISVLAIALAFVACEKEDIPVYDASRPSLNFVKSYFTPALNDPTLDTLKLVAVFYAGQEQADFKLPYICRDPLRTTTGNTPCAYRPRKATATWWKVYTSHSRQNRSSMQGNTPIRPSSMQTSPNCADKASGTLVFELVPGDDFAVGLEKYQSIGLEISGEGFTSQPVFWNKNDLNTYGGDFSSIKAEKYVELNGVTSDSWWESNKAKLYAYGKRTYEWFRDNPTYDNGERVMFIGTINYE